MPKLNTRITQKIDTEENWNKATNFTPLKGEIIVYDRDSNFSYQRIKVGDGTTLISNLPFVNDEITEAQVDSIVETVCGINIVSGEEVEL